MDIAEPCTTGNDLSQHISHNYRTINSTVYWTSASKVCAHAGDVKLLTSSYCQEQNLVYVYSESTTVPIGDSNNEQVRGLSALRSNNLTVLCCI